MKEAKDNKVLKVLELFAGIGACSSALTRLNIDYEIVDAVEIDKYAIASFNAIHNTDFPVQNICEWDKDIQVDLIMHGSPCQDFSVAGKQAGGDKESGTRSSLMYETIRIVDKLRPKYVIWENVKNILSKKHRHNFDNYLTAMQSLGYTNYYEVLNAKDYGIPQNRERVFTVSILSEEKFDFPKSEIANTNKIERIFNFSARNDCRVVYDIDGISPTLVAGMGEGGGKVPMIIESFEFPHKQKLKLRLKDILEDKVDEKYYLKEEQIARIRNSNFMQERTRVQEKEVCDTLLARDWKDPKCVRIGGIFDTETSKHQAGSIWDKNGLSPTIDTCEGGWRQPCIEQIEPKIDVIGNYSPSNHDASRVVNSEGLAPTVKENHGTVTATNIDYKIRKLTPKECWRLMGFKDEEFEKAAKLNSNTQLYKQARKFYCC